MSKTWFQSSRSKSWQIVSFCEFLYTSCEKVHQIVLKKLSARKGRKASICFIHNSEYSDTRESDVNCFCNLDENVTTGCISVLIESKSEFLFISYPRKWWENRGSGPIWILRYLLMYMLVPATISPEIMITRWVNLEERWTLRKPLITSPWSQNLPICLFHTACIDSMR